MNEQKANSFTQRIDDIWREFDEGKRILQDDMPGHDAMAKRMINDASKPRDRRIDLIEAMLLNDPPIHRQWDYTRWHAERIVDLIDDGIIPEEKEA